MTTSARRSPAPPRASSAGRAQWERAALKGPAALDALERESGPPPRAAERDLPAFCARRGLPDGFAWALRRPGCALSAKAAWALGARIASRLFDAPRGRRSSKARLDDTEAAVDRACLAIFESRGAPDPSALAALARQGRFAALRALMARSALDARLAQRVADARRGQAPSPLRASLAVSDPDAAIHQGARAGAALAPWSPRIDLSVDAESLDPAACAFAIAAGARPEGASRPPLAALCEAASRLHAPSNRGWLLAQRLSATRAMGAEPPEVLCARMLFELGCSAKERLPGRPSADALCRKAAAAQRASAGRPRSKARLAKIGALAHWIARQFEGSDVSPLDPERAPMAPLAALVRARAEREALASTGQPSSPGASRRL